jgi:streptogramin lyase
MQPMAARSFGGLIVWRHATNLLGIQNAANNANQLYNIQQSGPNSNAIARATTPNGNGTVPQATLDTLGNILAACVDSANTANSATAPTEAGASSQCYTLFENATTNGIPYGTTGHGTVPTDIATAAFNIAHYPAGASADTAAVMTALWAIQASGPIPYTPDLTAQPNDFTITIGFTGGGLGPTHGISPHSVAVDTSGNIYTANYTSNELNIFTPLGVPLTGSPFSGNGLNGPDSVAVDSTSSYVWIANLGSTSLSRFTTSGTTESNYPLGSGNSISDAEIDGSGNIWATTVTPTAYLVKLNSSGTVVAGGGDTYLTEPGSLAIEPTTGDVWAANRGEFVDAIGNYGYHATMYSGTTATPSPGSAPGLGGINGPVGSAIDSNGYIWFANSNSTVTALKTATTIVTGSPFTIGYTNDGIAIDGADNVWVTNTNGAGGVCELTNAGAAISPTAGYTATDPDGIAIDISGNVWYDSTKTTGTLYELVGAATPVVTPLSYAVANSKLGTKP